MGLFLDFKSNFVINRKYNNSYAGPDISSNRDSVPQIHNPDCCTLFTSDKDMK